MFSIISVMFLGIAIGYLMRNQNFLAKIDKSTSLTIVILLFVLGISMGSNSLIINNMGKFGWQAIILAVAGISGSILASFLVFHFFFKKGDNHEK
ncbi:LysO family transporter [Bacteroides reticulotermitis]|uniref:LysO family transporter n=1 Tax=Bacteroides reticulotermitis TaxID=1133319 RepID=UPI003A866395